MISEDQEVIDARQELENWKKMVEAAETEKSRLLLEKLDAEETKKNAQKETVALLTQQQKTADEALKRKHELEDEIKDLEKRNKALSERLKEYEERLSAKRATYATLQQKTKIKADIPDKKVKFVGVMKEEERDISSEDIQSHFTVICRPSFRLKGGQALLTFEEQTVAEKILRMTKCPVMFDNTKMDVKPYCVDLEPSVKFEKPSNGGGEVESIKYISKGRALTAYFSEDSPETES